MGFLRHRHPDPEAATRYRMRQRLLSIGDDYWIEHEDGSHAFRVDGKALRLRQTFVLEDTTGREVAKLQERKLTVRDKMEIEREGERLATVKKALVGIRDRFAIDVEAGADLDAKGNLVDHEYAILRDGDTVATVSKQWFAIRDTYGVAIAPGEDHALVLAITVCIDAMSHPRD
jgi:uncharacterized protein YxjI